MPDGFEMMIAMPAFAPEDSAQAAANAVVDIAGSSGGQKTILITLVVNYAVGLSANLIFGGINSLQIVGSLALFSIIVPPNSTKMVQFI